MIVLMALALLGTKGILIDARPVLRQPVEEHVVGGGSFVVRRIFSVVIPRASFFLARGIETVVLKPKSQPLGVYEILGGI
jgi:hypothetical protein